MARFDIRPRTIGHESAFSNKRVSVAGHQFETPAKALFVKYTSLHDAVRTEARGINEIYQQITPDDLQRERAGETSILRRLLDTQLRKSADDELTIGIPAWSALTSISPADAEYLLTIFADRVDVIATPVFPTLIQALSEGVAPADAVTIFDTIRESTDEIHRAADRIGLETPLMGTVPAVADIVEDITLRHVAAGTVAFCLDFTGRRPTAPRQIDGVLNPFHGTIATQYGAHGDTFVYAINATTGSTGLEGTARDPAEDFLALGLGVDVVGCTHMGANRRLLDSADGSRATRTPTLRVFDRIDYCYETYELDELATAVPAESGLSTGRVRDQLGRDPTAAIKYESLLRSEQMAVETRVLHSVITNGDLSGYLATKDGIATDTRDRMAAVRETVEWAAA